MNQVFRPRRGRLIAAFLLAACVAQPASDASAKWEPPHRRQGAGVHPEIAEPAPAPTAPVATQKPRTATSGQRAESAGADVPTSGVAVVIQKHRHTLTVFSNGTAIKEFPVVLGRNGRGPKRFEGDMRTPEGVYRVTDKHPHLRWRYFIGISYPNEYDVAAYAQAIADGGVPVIDGELIGIGGAVGIHGSDHYTEQAAGLDWTMGCIALRSDDVSFVYDVVKPGTPVLILP